MKEPLDHIERPRLPWRAKNEPSITECGHDASKVTTVTRDEFFTRFKEYGEQRTSLFTCMTCMQTARAWPTWEENPGRALEREIHWEVARSGNKTHRHRLTEELLAIALLIDLHRDEFATLLEQQKWRQRVERLESAREARQPE